MAKERTSKATSSADAVLLQNKPWKVWMSIAPQPSSVLVSLYDLIFNDQDELFYKGQPPSDPKSLHFRGLEHNIFIYDTALYSATGEVIKSAQVTPFFEEGIDVGIPMYDPRAKKRLVKTEIDGKEYEFALPDKDSAIRYSTAQDLYTSNNWRVITSATSCGNLQTCSAAPLNSNNAPGLTFILSSPDTVFDSTLVLEPTKKSFTKICLNIFNNENMITGTVVSSWKIINKLLADLSVETIQEGDNIFEATSSSNISIFENWAKTIEGKDILKHTYVWLKAAFAADYVDPKDFNQDLNQDANVIHKNLYSSSFNSDFNRYDTYDGSKSDLDSAALTRGYIPKNAPLKDLITNNLYTSEVPEITGLPLAQQVQALEKASSLDNTNIGSVLSEPVKNTGEVASLAGSVTPPQFFDSESRYASDEERTKLGRLPVGLPKYGNIYSDGRILSPTIDELWYMVKKLISGRPSDTDVNANTEDFGILKGTEAHENAQSTTISEIKNEFTFETKEEGIHKGDPVNFTISKDAKGDIESLKITEYFSQPDQAVYHNFKDINDDSEYYKKHGKANKVVDEKGALVQGRTPTYTNVQIEGITEYIGEAQIWKVRDDALSLRELEGRTLGLKFNLEKAYKDITRNFVNVGPLGYKYIYKDPVVGEQVSSAGTLYQLHRDYNFDAANPNTWFHMGGNHTGDAVLGGYDATFGDLENENHTDESNLYFYGKPIEEKYKKTSQKPLLRENYGLSKTLSEYDGEYYGSDIYLAADGTWRYKAEHIRVPILRSRY